MYYCHSCQQTTPGIHDVDGGIPICSHCSSDFVEQVQDRPAPEIFPGVTLDGLQGMMEWFQESIMTPTFLNEQQPRMWDAQPRTSTDSQPRTSSDSNELREAILEHRETQRGRRQRHRQQQEEHMEEGVRLVPLEQLFNSTGPMDPAMQFRQILMSLAMQSFQGEAELFRGPAEELHGQIGDYAFGRSAIERIMNQLLEQHAQENRPPAATEETMEQLPLIKFSQQGRLVNVEHKECTVCQEEYKADEEVIELPCKHIYHPGCILPWLKLNGTCPTCRYSLVESRETSE